MFYRDEQLRAVGYSRVASSNQNQDGNKQFSAQDNYIERYVEQQDLDLVECFYEVGKAGKVLQEAYDYCEEDNDIAYFVVSDLLRISRRPEVVEYWVSKFLSLGVEVARSNASSFDSLIPSLSKLLPTLKADTPTRKVRGN